MNAEEQDDLTLLERVIADSGDPELIPSSVLTAYRAGRVKAARALLFKHNKTERNPARKARQEEILRALRYWVRPANAPTMYTLNGVGTMLYGNYQPGEDGLHVATLWFTLVFIPFFPISGYLVAKAEEGGYYFFGKTPLPPFARVWRSLWATGALLLVIMSLYGAFMATTHTDVIAWNGFDVPIEVHVGDEQGTIAPHDDMTFRDVPAEAVNIGATANGITIEELEYDFAGTSGDTVLWNVGSRGVHEKLWVRYGPGDPPDGELISGGPVIVLDDIDYPFREAPDQKSVQEGSYIDNSMLSSLDVDMPSINLMMLLIGEERPDDALAMMSSEFLVNDESHEYAWFVSRMALADDPDAAKAWLRPILDARSDSIELHRTWQELHSPAEQAALLEEYRARVAAAPDSADAHYLLARLLDARDDETIAVLDKAIAADPTHSRSWGSLGWNKGIRGDYAGALAAYNKQVEVDPDAYEAAQPEILRLVSLTGGSLQDQLAVANNGMPEGMTSWLATHLELAARPSRADKIIEGWAGEDDVDPFLIADLYVTAGRLDSARGQMEGAESDMGMGVSTPIRLALSDGATDADRARAAALLPADDLPPMSEDQLVIALGFAQANGLDCVDALKAQVETGDLAGLVPAITGQADGVDDAIGGLGLRFQAAGAAALAAVTSGADRAKWRAHARKTGTPDELPFWR